MNQYHNQNKNENLSPRPIVIGFVLILLIIILFFSKKFLFTKNDNPETTNEDVKKEETREELSVPMILPEDLQKLAYKKTSQIIDIRSIEDFNYGHIENSKNIPIDSLMQQSNSLDKSIPIIIVDQVETKQGKEAVQYLNGQGFSAKYLIGGIVNFSEKGYSTISSGDPNSITDIAKVDPISPEVAMEKIQEELGLITFVDVRPEKQFREYHIDRSINIPLEEIEGSRKNIPVSKLIIVDEDPIRSFRAAVKLKDMNFVGVYCLKSSLSDFKKYVEEGAREKEESGTKTGS